MWPLKLIILIFFVNTINCYKLNVPKVLLPFHSSKVIQFILEAKSETPDSNEDLCFTWSSSRTDIVSITPIIDGKNGCSNRAIVSAVSRHSQRFTSIILAKEVKTDKLIRCDVIVDQINSIRIKHTTTHLYLEDSPECFTVEAIDDEGNTFSSIDGLAFEWTIINDVNEKKSSDNKNLLDILRFGKFIESEYEVSESIRSLEKMGLSGHKILIEGLKTGTSNVQAKLIDSFYKDKLKTPMVRLLVVANILLEPSYPVYLAIGAWVKYSVSLIKQTSIEKINLPSLQYYFESRNPKIADLQSSDPSGSTIVGVKEGTTDVVLIDRNMRDEFMSSQILPPPTAQVHVVCPDNLVFVIKNWRSWILETGRAYEIEILPQTDKKEQIYPSENLKIESYFDSNNFISVSESKNGSYHLLKAFKKGQTIATAKLIGIWVNINYVRPFDTVAHGQQSIELVDPIILIPKIVIFALSNSIEMYEYQFEVSGGSGAYYWQSKNTSIANVNSNGVIRTSANKVGSTVISVSDVKNIDIQARGQVFVLEPTDLTIQPCPVEAFAGGKLYLNIQMNTQLPVHELDDSVPVIGNQQSITDCSHLEFEVKIQDESIFKYVNVESPSNNNGKKDSCAVLVLEAVRAGKTSIKIRTLNYRLSSSDVQINSYSQLESPKHRLTLTPNSSAIINLFNGPFTSQNGYKFIKSNQVDSNSYDTRTVVPSDGSIEVLQTQNQISDSYSYTVICHKLNKDYNEVKFSISHKSTLSNKCPLVFDFQISVKCSEPDLLELSQLFVINDGTNDESLSKLKWRCPIKLSDNLITAHFKRPLFINTILRDVQNNIFDNFTSKNIQWNLDNTKLLKLPDGYANIQSIDVQTIVNSTKSALLIEPYTRPDNKRFFYQLFNTQETQGQAHISAQLKLENRNIQSNRLNINLVSSVEIKPNKLTLFNHPNNIVKLDLSKGSGYFHAEIESVKQDDLINNNDILKINEISNDNVVISPLTQNGLAYLNIFDYCVPPLVKELLDKKVSEPVIVEWPPSTSAEIQVAGINSIIASYEDDKLQINNRLLIYVQITDANGNLIKTSYFSLMNLNAKLVNLDSVKKDILLATITPVSSTEKLSNPIDKEYTAVYALTGKNLGRVGIQFEAQSDGIKTFDSAESNIISSQLKEILIYKPLTVEPKYIELIEGSTFQILTTGGPSTPDASLIYEIVSKNNQIINVTLDGVIFAISLGKVEVLVKSVGHVCQPFSDLGSHSRCIEKIERIYSHDSLIVNVIELNSIHLRVPIKTIKQGNEMPIYLYGNELSLSPLSFGSCVNLKYKWSISDQEIVSLNHDLSVDELNSNEDYENIFENAFTLRLKALKPGTVKISIQVTVNRGKIKYLNDQIEVTVFEQAYFNHLPLSYFNQKYHSDLSHPLSINELLLSPGSELQIQTNYDKLASKITYDLRFYDQNSNEHCNNSTINVNTNGLVKVARVNHQCVSALFVKLINQNYEQIIVYVIRVKPILYSLIRLEDNSATKHLFSSKTLAKNRFSINNGLHLKWHIRYYDNIGDQFDVLNINNKFSINRNDLVDFTQINYKIFHFGDSSDINNFSLFSNSIENSFDIKTLKSGSFIMELSQQGAASEFRTYLNLNIDNQNMNMDDYEILNNYNTRLEKTIGDIFCLEPVKEITSDSTWISKSPEVVKLSLLENGEFKYTGVCLNEGRGLIVQDKKQSELQSDKRQIEILVKPVEKIKFIDPIKYITNAITNPSQSVNSDVKSVNIQFMALNSHKSLSSNCSSEFERLLSKQKHNELVPFKCSASFYKFSTQEQLDYLDRLLFTNVVYINNNWVCDIKFISHSSSLFYELIESNVEKSNNKNIDKLNIRVYTGSKYSQTDRQADDFVQIPFIPAFYVQSKLIEIPIRTVQLGVSEYFNLVIYATQQLQSYITISTNCDTLVRIRPSSKKSHENRDTNVISYDIMSLDNRFDLSSFASVLQQNNGDLHIQISCSLTDQVEKIPIKFLFGLDSRNINFRTETSSSSVLRGLFANTFGILFDLTPNQITSFLILISLGLLTIICIIKFKSSTQFSSNQVQAPAMLNYHATGSPNRDRSSFNPYRYFDPVVEANLNDSRYDYRSASPRRSPQKFGTPTRSPITSARLFSTNASQYFDANTSGRDSDTDYNDYTVNQRKVPFGHN